MNQIKWFDRKFEFSFTQNIFPSIIERLDGTSLRLKNKVNQISSKKWNSKYNGTWSIKENIGHLNDLEPLWEGRLEDILNKEKYLRSADLENTQTDQANHNEKQMDVLLKEFQSSRNIILEKLIKLTEKEVYQSALHPRLETPMRMMDLFLFVAEHDDHHLARITELNRLL